jgi:hypothetical protein
MLHLHMAGKVVSHSEGVEPSLSFNSLAPAEYYNTPALGVCQSLHGVMSGSSKHTT